MNTGMLLTATLAALLASGAARAEHRIDASGGFGYDTNPFELSDEIGRREAYFIDGELIISAEGEAVNEWFKGADIGFSGKAFERDDRDADQAQLYVRAQGGTREQPDAHGFDWSLRSAARDLTYVSRLTGAEATDALGNDIGDRHDSLTAELSGEWRFPVTRVGRYSVGAHGNYRNYWEDYQSLGFDRLDYYEYGVAPAVVFGKGETNLRVRLLARQRDYFNRRVSDAAGARVPGTDLQYRFYGGNVRIQQLFSERLLFALNYDHELREDNGTGFGDRTQWSLAAEWSWRTAGDARWLIETRYRSRVLDDQSTGDTTLNDEEPERNGYEFSVNYSRQFPFLDIPGFLLYVRASHEDFDNDDDPRFVHERTIALVGVRQEF